MILLEHPTQEQMKYLWDTRAYNYRIFKVKCECCGKIFYTQWVQQYNCGSHECKLQKRRKLHKLKKQAIPVKQRYCKYCGQRVGKLKKQGAMYCSNSCRVMAYRKKHRKGE